MCIQDILIYEIEHRTYWCIPGIVIGDGVITRGDDIYIGHYLQLNVRLSNVVISVNSIYKECEEFKIIINETILIIYVYNI